ncbi:hypothetical protein [Streptomyces sp. NPDC127038]|uniref:hypothetical protein n=1 Tax=Streptomyces sp. NPDC127038 TaxID=3347114 RepID=UPI003650C2D3
MSDDERPDNVLTLPRIGSAPPPDLPPAPDLSAPAPADPGEGGGVRISPWDAPDIPHAPAAPDGAAVLRSEGADPPGTPDAGAPRAGALSLAAILAIALAAFEGMQTWVKEAVPLRAEAARHRRELELLAAKANADAHRLGAEASGVRRRGVPSGHDYGRSVLGSGTGGGRGRGGAGTSGRGNGSGGLGTGPGVRPGSGRGSTPLGSHNGPGRTHGPGRGGSSGSGSSGSRSGRSTFGGSASSTRGGAGSGNGSRGGGSWGSARGGGAGSSGGASGGSGGSSGRRSVGRKVADWWSKGKQSSGTGGASGTGGSSGGKGTGGAHTAATKAAVRNAVKAAKKGGPTFWDATGDKPSARWKDRTGPVNGGSGRAAGTGPGPVNTGWTPGGRTTFWQAVHETIDGRWNKRRADWKASGGPRRQRTSPRKPSAPDPSSTGTSAPNAGASSGDWAWQWARASAFDTGDDPVTVTVEQAGPARGHGTRWEPTPIAPARPQLPRAPQRPAGTRPGTTHRRDPFPMPPSASGSVQVTPPPANSMAGRHATEITLDGAVSALSRLTMAGMETYDDAQALAKQARRLLSELEAMGNDLAVTHNVLGPRTVRRFAVLMESVGMLLVNANRAAKSALAAAELAEAEEAAMERDYRPTQMAAVDAGLAAPSARIHNEN